MCLGCMTKPSFAHYTTANTCDWQCQPGYDKVGNTCVYPVQPTPPQCGFAIDTCILGTFSDTLDFGNQANWMCGTPDGGSVACTVYKITPPLTCGIGQYPINNSCQSCFSKPQNSNYTTPNSCDWACSSGYNRV